MNLEITVTLDINNIAAQDGWETLNRAKYAEIVEEILSDKLEDRYEARPKIKRFDLTVKNAVATRPRFEVAITDAPEGWSEWDRIEAERVEAERVESLYHDVIGGQLALDRAHSECF